MTWCSSVSNGCSSRTFERLCNAWSTSVKFFWRKYFIHRRRASCSRYWNQFHLLGNHNHSLWQLVFNIYQGFLMIYVLEKKIRLRYPLSNSSISEKLFWFSIWGGGGKAGKSQKQPLSSKKSYQVIFTHFSFHGVHFYNFEQSHEIWKLGCLC